MAPSPAPNIRKVTFPLAKSDEAFVVYSDLSVLLVYSEELDVRRLRTAWTNTVYQHYPLLAGRLVNLKAEKREKGESDAENVDGTNANTESVTDSGNATTDANTESAPPEASPSAPLRTWQSKKFGIRVADPQCQETREEALNFHQISDSETERNLREFVESGRGLESGIVEFETFVERKLGLNGVGAAKGSAKDSSNNTDKPLDKPLSKVRVISTRADATTADVATSSNTGAITAVFVSIAHVVADATTLFWLLEKWGEEYEKLSQSASPVADSSASPAADSNPSCAAESNDSFPISVSLDSALKRVNRETAFRETMQKQFREWQRKRKGPAEATRSPRGKVESPRGKGEEASLSLKKKDESKGESESKQSISSPGDKPLSSPGDNEEGKVSNDPNASLPYSVTLRLRMPEDGLRLKSRITSDSASAEGNLNLSESQQSDDHAATAELLKRLSTMDCILAVLCRILMADRVTFAVDLRGMPGIAEVSEDNPVILGNCIGGLYVDGVHRDGMDGVHSDGLHGSSALKIRASKIRAIDTRREINAFRRGDWSVAVSAGKESSTNSSPPVNTIFTSWGTRTHQLYPRFNGNTTADNADSTSTNRNSNILYGRRVHGVSSLARRCQLQNPVSFCLRGSEERLEIATVGLKSREQAEKFADCWREVLNEDVASETHSGSDPPGEVLVSIESCEALLGDNGSEK
jgi:hypothetical protein